MEIRTTMPTLLFVGLGGFLGANARYLASVWVPQMLPKAWGGLSGTFFVNLTGSLLLGLFLTKASQSVDFSPELRWTVATGFFGAYTTFSTFANETMGLIRVGAWGSALGYMLLTNIACLLGAFVGFWVAHRI